MAGSLHDDSTIHPKKMRILGKYAMILVLSGNVFYTDENIHRRDLGPGNAILVKPDQAHAYGSRDGQPWEQIYILFEGPQFELLLHSTEFIAHLPVWHLESPDLWQRRLKELFQPGKPELAPTALQVVSRFANLLVEMAAADARSRQNPSEAWLEDSLRLLGEPWQDRWLSARDVAGKVGLSYETFRKSFAGKTGISPGKFQQQRRIDLACTAIYGGSENFKELAERLGFCDVYHFSKAFRKITGTPPSVYRRTVRGS